MGEDGFVLCENEGEWKGIYRERGGCMFGHFGWEWVGKVNLNFMKVGGVYGEEWGDVNGEWGNWEEELK